mmetsp:Transcript_11453/g.15895  ORF Transcript_11453/g.15895 Transcript_11453/m.15895 type:complete len:115 (-) Transcript_11453:193-537(-)
MSFRGVPKVSVKVKCSKSNIKCQIKSSTSSLQTVHSTKLQQAIQPVTASSTRIGGVPPPAVHTPKNTTTNFSKDAKTDQAIPRLSNLMTIGASSKGRGIIGFGLGFFLMDPDDV